MLAGCVWALDISKGLVTTHCALLIHHVFNFCVVVVVQLFVGLLSDLLYLVDLHLPRLPTWDTWLASLPIRVQFLHHGTCRRLWRETFTYHSCFHSTALRCTDSSRCFSRWLLDYFLCCSNCLDLHYIRANVLDMGCFRLPGQSGFLLDYSNAWYLS